VHYFKNDLSLEFWVLAGLVAAGGGWLQTRPPTSSQKRVGVTAP